MSRLADRLVGQPIGNIGTVFVIDDLKWFSGEWDKDAVIISPDEYPVYYPNIAPPFEQFFIEGRRLYPNWFGLETVGCVCQVVDLEIEDDLHGLYVWLKSKYEKVDREDINHFYKAKWLVRMGIIMETKLNGKHVWPVQPNDLSIAILVDRKGKQITYWQHIDMTLYKLFTAYDENEQHLILYEALNPFVMCLSLINTKNIEVIDNIPPIKLSTTHEKKYGSPLLKYKTIKISESTLKHYQLDTSKVPPNSHSYPLHLVRGHFADYRDGKGLFGKYKDVFWIPDHVRGNAENGIVIKDYEVEAPKEEKSE